MKPSRKGFLATIALLAATSMFGGGFSGRVVPAATPPAPSPPRRERQPGPWRPPMNRARRRKYAFTRYGRPAR
jgi:hypothetical protein